MKFNMLLQIEPSGKTFPTLKAPMLFDFEMDVMFMTFQWTVPWEGSTADVTDIDFYLQQNKNTCQQWDSENFGCVTF